MTATTTTAPTASSIDIDFPEVQIETSSIDERARATFAKDHNRRIAMTFEDLFADEEK